MTDLHRKKRASFAGRKPVFDAIASPVNICVFLLCPPRSKGAFHLIRSLSAGEIPSLLWESPSFCLLALASWHLQVLGLRA